jgi:hypothetical protein
MEFWDRWGQDRQDEPVAVKQRTASTRGRSLLLTGVA